MNTTLTEKTADGSYVDWPAIFAGTVVAVAIGLLLTTFGAALGLSSITLDGTDNSSTLELVLTALWMVITLVASYPKLVYDHRILVTGELLAFRPPG